MNSQASLVIFGISDWFWMPSNDFGDQTLDYAENFDGWTSA